MPLDLNTIIFTPGKDKVDFSDTVAIAAPGTAIAIGSEGPIDTLGGNDRIEGLLDGTIGDFAGLVDVVGILQEQELVTGDGRDRVIGEVDFAAASPQPFGAFGILGTGAPPNPFDTGAGNDRVEGHARVEAQAAAVFGLANLDLDTGDGRDTVIGKADATALSDDAELIVMGIVGGDVAVGEILPDSINELEIGLGGDNLPVSFTSGVNEISTGDGNDKVDGSATLDLVDAFSGIGWGIVLADINTGSGRDNVSGSAVITGDPDSGVGIIGSTVDTGDGNDGVSGSVTVMGAGDNAALQGMSGIADASIVTGSGRDKVEGTASVEFGDDGRVEAVVGIVSSTIDTGDGNDSVVGEASGIKGSGGFAAEFHGLENVQVTTGDGRDQVEGKASIQSDGLTEAFGSGIVKSTINTGANDDRVVGTGADVAVIGTSDGIVDSTINLGSGDDEVTARGASQGVRNVDIFGDTGDDIFDLHSGTGLVDGGDDNDLLILDGDSGSFDFTNTGVASGTIATSGGGITNLDVANIEQFQFDNGTFDFGDLF